MIHLAEQVLKKNGFLDILYCAENDFASGGMPYKFLP
jgi:hypothetical protein